jgi:hypothetical protein
MTKKTAWKPCRNCRGTMRIVFVNNKNQTVVRLGDAVKSAWQCDDCGKRCAHQ